MEYDKSILITMGFILFFIMLSYSCGNANNSPRRTDGVFESATRKLDRGQSLNQTEQQRINDLINWKDSRN